MMIGVNVDATRELAETVTVPVIASGGVTDMNCIAKLNEIKNPGIQGVIIGRALYEGTISLEDALAYLHQH